MSDVYWLTDEQMARLRPYFPKSHGKPWVDDRRVLSGIIFVNRNGSRWCDAPKEYGPHKTLYNRWKRWGEMGVFLRMMEGLAADPCQTAAGQYGRCKAVPTLETAAQLSLPESDS
jgi:transposase